MGHSLYTVFNADRVKDIEELGGKIFALEGLKECKEIFISPVFICPTYPRQLLC